MHHRQGGLWPDTVHTSRQCRCHTSAHNTSRSLHTDLYSPSPPYECVVLYLRKHKEGDRTQTYGTSDPSHTTAKAGTTAGRSRVGLQERQAQTNKNTHRPNSMMGCVTFRAAADSAWMLRLSAQWSWNHSA